MDANPVEQFVIWILSLSSLTVLLARGGIFYNMKMTIMRLLPARFGIDHKAMELMFCSQCLGFWVGILGAWLIEFPTGSSVIKFILIGALVSTISLTIDRICYGRDYSDTE